MKCLTLFQQKMKEIEDLSVQGYDEAALILIENLLSEYPFVTRMLIKKGELIQLLPWHFALLPAAPGKLKNLSSAFCERCIDVVHGQVLELPRLVPLWLGELIESVPLNVELVGELLLVLACLFADVQPHRKNKSHFLKI